jgi:hypothetical protein
VFLSTASRPRKRPITAIPPRAPRMDSNVTPCGTGPLDGGAERREYFEDVLQAMGLIVP